MAENAARSMRAVLERRTAHAAYWARRIASFSAVLFVVAGLGHRFGVVETVPLLNVLAVVGGLAVLALVLAFAGLVRIWRRGDRGVFSALGAVAIAFCVLAPFAVSGVRMAIHPAMFDISTDLAQPPQFSLALRERTPAMNPIEPIGPAAVKVQTDSYPAVAGRRYEYPKDRVLEAVNGIITERGWRLLGHMENADGHTVTIEAVASSFFLGFASDVVIRIFDDDSATFVDMRSASRYGGNDLGDNARRIVGFMSDLDDRMAALAGL